MITVLTLAGAIVGGLLGAALRHRRYIGNDVEPLGWASVAAAAILAATVMGLLAWRVADPWILLLGCLFAAGGVVAAWTDLDAHLLLDILTLPLAGALLAVVTVAAAANSTWSRWGVAVAAGITVAGVLLLWAIFGSLGLGDVKFGFSVGLVLGYSGGWPLTLRGVTTALLLAAVVAIGLLAMGRSRKAHLPLGPALALGVVVSLLW